MNKRADNGTTPIYFAAQEGRLDCLQFLVSQVTYAAGQAIINVTAVDRLMGIVDCEQVMEWHLFTQQHKWGSWIVLHGLYILIHTNNRSVLQYRLVKGVLMNVYLL